MSLRTKTLLIIGITLFGLLGILFLFSRVILLRSFSQLEKDDIQQNTARVAYAIQSDVDNLSYTNLDWAAWDDTVDFVEGNYPAYVEDNLGLYTINNLEIHIMAYYDRNGELFYSLSSNESGEEAPLPQGFIDLIESNPELVHHTNQESLIEGIITIPEGTLLFSSRPILPNDQLGSSHGSLIMARFMDEEYLQSIAERTQLSVVLYPLSDPQIPADFTEAQAQITLAEPSYSQPLDADTIAGYILQENIFSQPDLMIRVDKPRDIYNQGQFSINYFLLSMLGVGIGFVIVSGILLERTVLSRLYIISNSIREIRKQGDLSARVPVSGRDELTNVSTQINRMLESIEENDQQLKKNQQQLEQNNQDLTRRARELQIIAEITRDTTTLSNLEELLDHAVRLIREQFNFYYAAFYFVNPENQSVILQSASSDEDLTLMEYEDLNGNEAEESIVAQVAKLGIARIVYDISKEDQFVAKPHLPLSRSVAALPLWARDEIIGVLNIHDTRADAFDDENISVLQTLADQIAIAIYNTRLLQQSQENLEAVNRAYGELSSKAWNQFLMYEPDINFISTPFSEQQIRTADWSPEMSETYRVGQITQHGDKTIHIPIILRDQTLGVVRLQKREGTGSWSEDEIELMDTLVDQLETALETARLYTDTQRQGQRERLTHEVTDKLHRSMDMDALMQTLLQEISNALGVSEAFVQLSTSTPTPDSASKQIDSAD
ncbi:MAG TPA: hypothetical protein DEH22_09070 [Chloroflexi bacterium]|nr:hypothetical protein [Chloroflexota bacterium]